MHAVIASNGLPLASSFFVFPIFIMPPMSRPLLNAKRTPAAFAQAPTSVMLPSPACPTKLTHRSTHTHTLSLIHSLTHTPLWPSLASYRGRASYNVQAIARCGSMLRASVSLFSTQSLFTSPFFRPQKSTSFCSSVKQFPRTGGNWQVQNPTYRTDRVEWDI